MDPEITFEWEGKRYTVPSRAAILNRIVLPDNRVLKAYGGWQESLPPVPQRLAIFPNLASELAGARPEDVAEMINGVVATEECSS